YLLTFVLLVSFDHIVDNITMLSKFLTVFVYILLFMGIWALLLLPVALAADGENGGCFVALLLLMVVLIFVSFVPFLNIAIRRSFRFPGEGMPVSKSELRQVLLNINQFDVPVTAEERGDTIVFTWRYVDAKWWEILAKAGLKSVYECHVKLNDKKKTATLIDITRSVSWRAGPSGVELGWSGFRGVELGYEIGKAYGLKENFELGKIYDYQFSPQEIKNPVMNTILRHGWEVRFGMW
ncbi:MAG: hypothetical protein R6X32_22000, partial [Chloroflexota bacterium]